jgi:[glutamine synthetase] adenylyltransferase / [glutamine synthetase]-adenylyl-L-tyrosine phosphorylase
MENKNNTQINRSVSSTMIARSESCSEKAARITKIILHNYTCIPLNTIISILNILLDSFDTEQGLLRFDRFLTTMEGVFIIDSADESFSRILGAVFSKSSALALRLTAAPECAVLLSRIHDPYSQQTCPELYLAHLEEITPPNASISMRIRAIHHLHTIHLSRICARNADSLTPMEVIASELSALAEAVVSACLAVACEEIIPQNKNHTTSHSFFVLALGKFGGKELNVSSDIDLIYLVDRDNGWESFDTMTLYSTLAERFTQLLSGATVLGYLYRVDTRLRADGASGPLVRTTSDYLRYLEMRGQAWERQMLLKARPVAGAIEAGKRFISTVQRFIFPTSITRSPNREIVAIKNQIETRLWADGGNKSHLKLMPGGIRDIEFITQCLQLLMGGTHPGLRITGTLPALTELHRTQALSDIEYETLSNAYILYRRVESALMWRELLQAFHIPEDTEGLARLEHDLAVSNLRHVLDNYLAAVRNIYNDVFSIEKEESFEELSLKVASNQAGDDNVRRFLENLGFTDPYKSAQDVYQLIQGGHELTSETFLHPAAERFLPHLLKALSNLPDPGGALENLRKITVAYQAQITLFDLMTHNHKFLDLLLSIAHGSVFMTDLLAHDPSLLDWLFEAGALGSSLDRSALKKDLAHISHNEENEMAFSRECLRIKNLQKLRIGTRDITGITHSADTFSELTTLAELIVQTVYHRAENSFYSKHPLMKSVFRFAVLSAGKLGAGQMDFGSDLDLIFIYTVDTVDSDIILEANQAAIVFAQDILNLLAGGGVYRVYAVDARLRPEGGNSPLAVSLSEYARYLEKRAAVWERLALVRVRYIAGNVELGQSSEETTGDFVYRAPLTSDELKSILSIRESMVLNSSKKHPGLINIKSGRGGLADIDFIAQSYACHYGMGNPAVRYRHTGDILRTLGEQGYIPRDEIDTLNELTSFHLSVEKAIRIGSGKAVVTLPEGGAELARVTRLLGFKNIRQFSRRMQDVMSLTRELYDRRFAALEKAADASSSKI